MFTTQGPARNMTFVYATLWTLAMIRRGLEITAEQAFLFDKVSEG
jgi:hypothetical protein